MTSAPTTIDIAGEDFLINGNITFPGRTFRGHRIEGLLPNSRMIQGVFDDLNPETRANWKLPDGSDYDADRNTGAFIAAMPEWRAHGLLAFTVGMQGGSPFGYSKHQPWENSAFTPEGALRPAYAQRLERILAAADELGMVAIVSYFYFGQTPRFPGLPEVQRAADEMTDWLAANGRTNVLIEVVNEANTGLYPEQPWFHPEMIGELIQRIQQRSAGRVQNRAGRFYVAASQAGGDLPPENLLQTTDIVLLHGNGVGEPERIREMVRYVRNHDAYRGQPIVFNEDDHFQFDQPGNNFIAATSEHASWGFFDYRMKNEPFECGYQSMPCDWGIQSDRKRGFFSLLKQMTLD